MNTLGNWTPGDPLYQRDYLGIDRQIIQITQPPGLFAAYSGYIDDPYDWKRGDPIITRKGVTRETPLNVRVIHMNGQEGVLTDIGIFYAAVKFDGEDGVSTVAIDSITELKWSTASGI